MKTSVTFLSETVCANTYHLYTKKIYSFIKPKIDSQRFQIVQGLVLQNIIASFAFTIHTYIVQWFP